MTIKLWSSGDSYILKLYITSELLVTIINLIFIIWLPYGVAKMLNFLQYCKLRWTNNSDFFSQVYLHNSDISNWICEIWTHSSHFFLQYLTIRIFFSIRIASSDLVLTVHMTVCNNSFKIVHCKRKLGNTLH